MGCANSKPDGVRDMYLDPNSVLKVYDPAAGIKHIGSEELAFVGGLEGKAVTGGEEFYLISVDWLTDWLSFAKGTAPQNFARKIDNSMLIDPQCDYKLRETARFKKEYRAIDKDVWEYYFERYGGGPVIVFYGELRIGLL
jgi:hypothetical protein